MIIAIGCAAGRIMSTLGLPFAAINTDWRELENCAADRKLPISQHGLGAGANPVIGAQAAEEAAEAIATLCTEPVLLVAGLGAWHRHGCRSRRGQDRQSARLRGHRRGDVAVSL